MKWNLNKVFQQMFKVLIKTFAKLTLNEVMKKKAFKFEKSQRH